MANVVSIARKFSGLIYGIVNSATGLNITKRYGETGSPSTTMNYTSGTGSNQANVVYRYDFSLGATTGVNIDLRGGAGELDVTGAALSFTEIRDIEVYISTTQAANVNIRVGPQNETNGWLGPWSVITANGYTVVYRRLYMDFPFDGSLTTVDATHKILRLYNPNAGTVAGSIVITGTNA